jgi:hypothetical protein
VEKIISGCRTYFLSIPGVSPYHETTWSYNLAAEIEIWGAEALKGLRPRARIFSKEVKEFCQ